MVTNVTQRPTFYEGQYLGAADLTAAIEYGRAALARHDLGGHTWGIAMGLQLKETPSAAGGDKVDVTILPGYAWDGFGRPIVLLQPTLLPGTLFSQVMPDGNPKGVLVPVWLCYREIPAKGPRPGFEPCDPNDAYARVQETFVIEIGTKTADERHDSINVAGRQVDAQGVAQALLGATPPITIYDESIPYQILPDPSQNPPRWLVPIGLVRWLPGPDPFTPGSFVKSDDDKPAARALRRYAGVVAEEVAAADGIIRLRDRTKPYSSIRTSELAWVEGDLRIDGDARLFGSKLEFRRADGTDNGVPLTAQRAETQVAGKANTSLQVTIGVAKAGDNSFAIGTSDLTDPQNPKFVEKFIVRDNARAGLGTTNTANAALTVEDAQVPLAIGVTGQEASPGGLWRVALGNGTLRFDANIAAAGDFSSANTLLAMTQDGKVGVNTSQPTNSLHVQGALGVRQNRLFMSGGDGWSSLAYNAHHNDANNAWVIPDPARKSVTIEMDDAGNVPRFEVYTNTAGAPNGWVQRLSIKGDTGNVLMAQNGGRVGIGTTNPRQALSVNDAVNIDQANGNSGAINPGLTFGLDSGEGIASRRTPGTNRFGLDFYTLFLPRMSITNGGLVGIGTTTPGVRLHVVDSKSGGAGDPLVHVALIENTDVSTNADVLALKIGKNPPGGDNNYITFFGGNTAIGRIEGGGAGVVLKSPGADFAECLPRLDSGERLEAGDLVGIINGKVTRSTAGAQAVSVVTSRPVVVGNAPQRQDEHLFAQVAFVGQLPVKVRGPVRAGDLIIPSGLGDGTGVAVPSGSLTPQQAAQVVGQAWESKPGRATGFVRAAVNLNIGVRGQKAEGTSRPSSIVHRPSSIVWRHRSLGGNRCECR